MRGFLSHCLEQFRFAAVYSQGSPNASCHHCISLPSYYYYLNLSVQSHRMNDKKNQVSHCLLEELLHKKIYEGQKQGTTDNTDKKHCKRKISSLLACRSIGSCLTWSHAGCASHFRRRFQLLWWGALQWKTLFFNRFLSCCGWHFARGSVPILAVNNWKDGGY